MMVSHSVPIDFNGNIPLIIIFFQCSGISSVANNEMLIILRITILSILLLVVCILKH